MKVASYVGHLRWHCHLQRIDISQNQFQRICDRTSISCCLQFSSFCAKYDRARTHKFESLFLQHNVNNISLTLQSDWQKQSILEEKKFTNNIHILLIIWHFTNHSTSCLHRASSLLATYISRSVECCCR